MKTKTMTINIDESVERRFKRAARLRYGKRKGSLGKAVGEALEGWVSKQRGHSHDKHMLETMEKGFRLGGVKIKNRAAWHER